MGTNPASVTFFFPYRQISGVPVLFLRMARHLADRHGIDTRVIDYPDGYMARTLRETGAAVKILPFHDGVPLTIPPDTLLIMQSILPYTIRPELRIDRATRVAFWTLYHLNLIQTIIPLPWFRHVQTRYRLFHDLFTDTLMISLKHRLQALVRDMNDHRALFFMDGSTLRFTAERLAVAIRNPVYLPLACEDVPQNPKKPSRIERQGPLHVCWVGRIADFKTPILVYTIGKLSEVARKKRMSITFHVIGEGPDEAMIRSLNVEHDCFRLIYAGVKAGRILDDYLLKRIHVLAAMGTSALEGARLGLPTILLDASYGPVGDGYRYRWLFESEEYGLGDIIGATHYEKGNDSLEKRIDALISDGEELSEKTYEYCRKNHFISSVGKRFLALQEAASFRYGDFQPQILQKGPVRRSYEFMRQSWQ
jgi:hypothetical protein